MRVGARRAREAVAALLRDTPAAVLPVWLVAVAEAAESFDLIADAVSDHDRWLAIGLRSVASRAYTELFSWGRREGLIRSDT